jgi:ABC-type cobalamin transport system permease subunit
VGGDGAHLGVDDGGQTLDVGGIGAAEVIDLIVDLYTDRLGLLADFVHVTPFSFLEEFVHLLEHLFYALADRFALLVEGLELGLGGAGLGAELGQLIAEGGDLGLGGGAGFAFALDDLYGTEDFLFEGLEFVDADGRCTHI